MTFKMCRSNFDYQWSDSDIANPDDMIAHGDFNPYNIHPFLLLNGGFVQCVVFAEHLQDALDEAVDRNKLDAFQVTDSELSDYETGTDSEGYPEYDGITHLGNANEPFDIESLDIVELSTKQWTPEFWTLEQVQTAIEGMDPEGRTEKWVTDNADLLASYRARESALLQEVAQ